jgi:uncharacterized protein YktB (UPF0637 family)
VENRRAPVSSLTMRSENKKAGQALKASAVLDQSRSTSLPVTWSASFFSKFGFNRRYGFSVGVLWTEGVFLLFSPLKQPFYRITPPIPL